jgi:hypothetical protein
MNDTCGSVMHRGVMDRCFTAPLECLCCVFHNTVPSLWIHRSSLGYEFDIANFGFCREVVRQWRERGVRVMPWTVNLPLEKQYFSRILKVTYLTDTLIGENDEPNFLWLCHYFVFPVTYLLHTEMIVTCRKLVLTCLPWKCHFVSKMHVNSSHVLSQ